MTGWVRRMVAAVAVVALAVGAGGCSYERDRERVREANGGDPLRLDPELVASLSAFDACDDLLSYLRTEGAKLVGPYGFGGGPVYALASGGATSVATAGPVQEDAAAGRSAAAPALPAAPLAAAGDERGFSTTNVQEAGVDEPDLVKTDGRRLVALARGQLRVVDLTGAEPRLVASMPLAGDAGYGGYEGYGGYGAAQLLLDGERVLVLRPTWAGAGTGAAVGRRGVAPSAPADARPRTVVTAVDLTDAAAPKVAEEATFDGELVAARMVDGNVRLVLRNAMPNLPFLFPSGSQESVDVALEANRRVVAESDLDDWLPRFEVGDGGPRRTTDCSDVRRPAVFSGLGMVTVVSVSAADLRPGPGATVLGAGDTVYATPSRLYVTSSAWQPQPQPQPEPQPAPPAAPCPAGADCSAPRTVAVAPRTIAVDPGAVTTEIHAFAIGDPVRITYEASGRVPGRLLSSYSLSEDKGVLRVATTDDAAQVSAVRILRQTGDRLEEVGAVTGLGRGERIYAVRFLGDRGYVVTFRQTDPLFVLDLSDPARPALAGELQIPGYSAYLHPVGDGRLLGVGQDATEQGRVQGTQLSLFDVADPAAPKRLASVTSPWSRSEVETDPHAFLWWAPAGLAVVPVQDGRTGTAAAVAYTVGADSIVERGRVTPPDGSPVRRNVVVGDRLLTLSDSGIATTDVASVGPARWLAF